MSQPRPIRSKIRHGMPSCARYGCKRPECTRAYRIAHARNEMDRARGISGFTPADEATYHINKLLRAGLSISDITEKSGLSRDRIGKIGCGVIPRITRTTHEAILGVPIPLKLVQPQANGKIDAIGAQRRLQALAALGWSREDISARTGISPRTIGDVRRGDKARVLISHHQAIIHVYEELWNQHPEAHGASVNSAARLRALAKKQGWKRPADLDDELIDWRQVPRGAAA